LTKSSEWSELQEAACFGHEDKLSLNTLTFDHLLYENGQKNWTRTKELPTLGGFSQNHGGISAPRPPL